VGDASFVDASRRIATVTQDGKIHLWERSSSEQLSELVTDAVDGTAAINPSVDRYAAVRANEVVVASSTSPKATEVVATWAASFVRFSPRGDVLLVGGGERDAMLWSLTTQGTTATFADTAKTTGCGAFAVDGARVALGSRDGRIGVFSAAGTRLATLAGHTGPINNVDFSRDGRYIVSASADCTARVWDAETGAVRSVLDGQRSILSSAALNADGSLAVTGSNDGQVQFWDTQRARLLFTYDGHAGPVYSAAFSPDDERVLTAGGSDQTARLWDARLASISAASLRSRVRCEVGLELRDGNVLPLVANSADCEATSK